MRRLLVAATVSALVAMIMNVGSVGASAAGRNSATTRAVTGRPNVALNCHLWAVVNSDGSLARTGCAGTTSNASAGGGFDVVFTNKVRGCVYIATIGTSADSGIAVPGYVEVVGAVGDPDGVFVDTFDSSGTVTAEGFHLSVDCSKATSPACDTWAVVNSDGSLARSGCPGVAAGGSGGGYDVLFTKNVSACAFQATIGSSADSGSVPAGFVTVVGESSFADGVYVQTFDSAGAQTAEGFHLLVTCGQPQAPACDTWAVVKSGSSLARSGCVGATSSHAGESGTYYVVFTTDIVDCAYEATLGLAAHAGQAPPGFVTVVGAGESPDGVYVETFNAAGKRANEGFHLTVAC